MNLDFITAICRVFAREPTLQCTIRALSKKAKLSYNATYRTIEDLLQQNILHKETYGKASVISLKNTPQTLSLISFAAYSTIKEPPKAIPEGKAILSHHNQWIAIVQDKKASMLTKEGETFHLLTIQEWLAEVSKQEKTLKNMQIISGAEYLYKNVLEHL